jgi:hypothetical protein
MAKLVNVRVVGDHRGSIGILDRPDSLPFKVKRILYIFDAKEERGGHAHKKTSQALICIRGVCDVFVNNGVEKNDFKLDSPDKCLLLNPEDWHKMRLSVDAILLALGSEYYDPDDYVYEEPE